MLRKVNIKNVETKKMNEWILKENAYDLLYNLGRVKHVCLHPHLYEDDVLPHPTSASLSSFIPPYHHFKKSSIKENSIQKIYPSLLTLISLPL